MVKVTFMAEDGTIHEDVEVTYVEPYGKLVYFTDKGGNKRRTLASREGLAQIRKVV
mgnify:FL=1